MLTYLTRKKEYLFTFLILLYCVYDLIHALSINWAFTTDDAYISWYYARQLIQGKGLFWHSQLPVVEGYSNFLWVLISALILKLKLPLLSSMKLISCLSLGATLIFLYRFSRLFFTPLLASLPPFIFSHYIGISWWTMSGLEGLFYCALTVLMTWQCTVALGYTNCEQKGRSYQTPAWIIVNCSFLLVCLTRFEGIIWIVPLACFIFCHLIKGTLADKSPPYYPWLIISLFCFLIPYTIYFFWRIYYFGHLIPNSYSCKSASADYFILDLDYFVTLIPLLVSALPYFLYPKDCRHWLLWVPSAIYALLLWKAAFLVAIYLRLFLAPFALFCLTPVLGFIQLLEFFKLKWDYKIITACSIIAITLLFLPGNNQNLLRQRVAIYQERTKNRLLIAQILDKEAIQGDSVLISDCGLIPFSVRKDIRFIDALCLNNPSFNQKPYHGNLSLYADYLIKDLQPRWVIVNEYPMFNSRDPLIHLLQEKRFFDKYQVVAFFRARVQENTGIDYRLYKKIK